jgi:limonene-1,2-epoxide hydrolase
LRLLTALAMLLAALLAGCGGSPGKQGGTLTASNRSVTRIVRAWSRAINSDDNEAAADLFARNARVIQGGVVLILRTHADAVAWNAGLPCSGHIVRISTTRDTATAEFVLGDRPSSACDGPGQRAAAVFQLRGGKIVVWRQVPVQSPPALSA